MSHINRYKGSARAACNTVVLPKNGQYLGPDVLLEDFEAVDDWTAANGSVAANTTAGQFRTGTQSIKLTTDAAATATMTKTVSWAGLGSYEWIGFWFYMHDIVANYAKFTSITFSISSTADFSKSFSYTLTPNGTPNGLLAWPYGNPWLVYRVPLTSFTNNGSESWSNTMIRIRFTLVSSSGVVEVSFDDLEAGYKRIASVLFRHDGPYDQVVTTGASNLHYQYGMRGDLYIGMQPVISAASHRQTPTMIKRLYDEGWCVGSYHYGSIGTTHGMGDYTLAQQEWFWGNLFPWIRTVLNCPGGERHCTFSGAATLMNNADSPTALANIQGLTALGGYGSDRGSSFPSPYLPPGDLTNIEFRIMGTTTLANAKAMIDSVIARGQYLIYNFDALDAAGITSANYMSWIDYIYGLWKQGLIYPLTMDELYRLTLGAVRTTRAGYRAPHYIETASTWTQPNTLFNITHEGNNLNEYDLTSTDSGNLSVASGAALNGTNYGLNIHYTGTTTAKYASKQVALMAETTFRCRFYYDPNSITLASTSAIIFQLTSSDKVFGSYSSYNALRVQHRYSSSTFQLRLWATNDAGTATQGSYINIADAPHYVEVQLTRASAAGIADGEAKMWIDGTLQSTVSNVANYNLFRFSGQIDIGACAGGNAGNSGDYFIDEIKANRDGSEIGA